MLPPALLVAIVCAVVLAPERAHAGAWTLEEGRLWGKLAVLHLSSDQLFATETDAGLLGCANGAGEAIVIGPRDRRPYDCTTGGTFRVTAVYAELALGLLDELEVSLQVPWIADVRFSNTSGLDGRDSGIGDLRASLRYRVLAQPFVGTLAFQVKVPSGRFTTDEAVPPLGEGQWDLTFSAQAGRSFGRGYLNADVGYRVRLPNDDTRIDVGDEILTSLEGGASLHPRFALRAASALLWGFESENVGSAVLARPRRWVLEGRFTAAVVVHEHVGLEAFVFVPLVGEGWPANATYGIAVSGTTPKLWDRRRGGGE